LDLHKADLRWRDPEVAVEAASGTVEFAREGLRGRGIAARVLGLPVELVLYPQTVEGRLTTVIEARGQVDSADLQARLPAPLGERLHGQTTWLATVTLPEVPPGGRPAPFLHLASDLHGLALDLPTPFAKPADQPRSLVIETALGGDTRREIHAAYGTLASAVIELAGDGHLVRGEVRLGEADAVLPAELGLRVRADLAATVLDDWIDLAVGFTGGGAGADRTDDRGGNDIALKAKVGNLRAGRHPFTGVELSAGREREGWNARFTAREAAGRLHWPDGGVLDLDLERLYLTDGGKEGQGAEEQPSDPHRLPALRLRCADLRLDDLALGRLEVETRPDPEGLVVKDLHLRTPTLRVDGEGRWSATGKDHSSSFDLHFETADLGATLSALGYLGAVEGGPGQARLHAHWHGPPSVFALERLDGTLAIEVGKGRLLQVSPGGAGRVFGLLSLQALPRRLALDFSDVFRKGLAFDRIQGDFRIENGNAYSDNLKLQGPAANIDIKGRTGLAAQDYDQVVTVTPNVGGTLPLAGALAAGSVGVGAAILLAQRLFQLGIDRITQARYTLRGPWDDPRVAVGFTRDARRGWSRDPGPDPGQLYGQLRNRPLRWRCSTETRPAFSSIDLARQDGGSNHQPIAGFLDRHQGAFIESRRRIAAGITKAPSRPIAIVSNMLVTSIWIEPDRALTALRFPAAQTGQAAVHHNHGLGLALGAELGARGKE
jgi:uncharacterized protein (TIGR02099 family)